MRTDGEYNLILDHIEFAVERSLEEKERNSFYILRNQQGEVAFLEQQPITMENLASRNRWNPPFWLIPELSKYSFEDILVALMNTPKIKNYSMTVKPIFGFECMVGRELMNFPEQTAFLFNR